MTTKSILDSNEYARLHAAVFADNYPGYRPKVVESPDGDGKWDADKRYAHVAMKYLQEYSGSEAGYLYDVLFKMIEEAVAVSVALGVPPAFWPKVEDSTLRILEYPPGATTAPHFDFDLFTLMCYRNIPENFAYCGVDLSGNSDRRLVKAQELNEQIHFGELLEIVCPAYKATRHKVIDDPHGRTQYSAVFFGIPDHDAVLPSSSLLPGKMTVGEWLDERMARSRKTVE